jgi:type IV secretory pathway VirB2 component (pilin)
MKNYSKQLLKISLATASILALFPILSSNSGLVAEAFAQANVSDVSANFSSNSLTRVMCNALRIVTGSAGKTFATFAVIATGIGFFTGKVSWGLMIGVAAGIATMFGGPSIVAAISGQSTDMMCSIN